MIRAFAFAFVLVMSGVSVAAASTQDPHAGHAGHAATSSVVTTPADGAMTHGSPERFTVVFPHPMILKTVTLTAAGQAPVVVNAPVAPAATTAGVALPRLAPGTYTAAWTAEAADGHRMSGSIRFMVH